MKAFPERIGTGRLCAVCILLQAGMLAWIALRCSPTYDEVAYLPAGVSHWQLGRFDLAKVSPPLVRLVAAIPVLAIGARTDWRSYETDPSMRAELSVGRDFIAANGRRSFWLFTIARWACLPFTLLGAVVCAHWARALYGAAAGVLAALLWCLSPMVLSHGSLVTADVAAAALGALSGYLFWRWLRQPGWHKALVAGLILGLTELSKTTWIILFPLWPALWLVDLLLSRRASGDGAKCARFGSGAVQLLAMELLAVGVINIGYGCENSGRPLGQYAFVSELLSGVHRAGSADGRQGALAKESGNRFANGLLCHVLVPLPASYVYGIDLQRFDFESRMWSYLGGQWQLGGWWYYYLYALAVKVPLGTILLAYLALLLRCAGRGYSAPARDELVLLAPAATVLLLVSSQTGLSHHLRYLLPAFPFAFIWIGSTAQCLRKRHRTAGIVMITATVWMLTSSLSVYPHSLSYFNELAGGPLGGRNHLGHSNLDWGQDLLYLQRWWRKHRDARPLHLDYFPAHLIDPRWAGMDYVDARGVQTSAVNRGLGPGWYAVSVREMQRPGDRWQVLRELQPVCTVGYTIWIYHIAADTRSRGDPSGPQPDSHARFRS